MLRAILIDCIPPSTAKEEAVHRMAEAESLITTYGGVVLIKKIQKKLVPSYKSYLSPAKIEEIIEENKTLKADIVIVNNELKPRQTYHLNEALQKNSLYAWDRIDLILKIFQKHAKTREAKLEIELASIRHMGPRIFGMGMELSRQGGGIGTKGVGETNTEFMKRHLAKMQRSIEQELEACKKVRKLHRSTRQRRNLKTVGIIGYTNAGKTSLLNALTKKGAYAANKLFATLDTRVGKMYLPGKADTANLSAYVPPQEILISDTIGFIQDLPPTLIKSFQSTLEETIEADLLLHVIDLSDPKMNQKMATVNKILAQINALFKPTIHVFNKADLAKNTVPKTAAALKKKLNIETTACISSLTGQGISQLKELIATKLSHLP